MGQLCLIPVGCFLGEEGQWCAADEWGWLWFANLIYVVVGRVEVDEKVDSCFRECRHAAIMGLTSFDVVYSYRVCTQVFH